MNLPLLIAWIMSWLIGGYFDVCSMKAGNTGRPSEKYWFKNILYYVGFILGLFAYLL